MNQFLDWLKKNRLLKFLYRLPGVPKIYHTVLAFLAALFFGFPSRRLFVIGVTGTKGKSTVCELIGFILERAGRKTAISSSVHNDGSSMTMPGRFFLQKFLRQAVRNGCQYAIIETTSQGVALNRHYFIQWDAAVFTNLAPEHIEAHGSFERYREEKVSFFRYVASRGKREKFFFINKDDPNAHYFTEAAVQGKIFLYEKSGLSTALLGGFNAYNAGAAAAVAKAQGIDEKIIKEALAAFPGVPGRMELVQKEPFAVVVDYALTPDSLQQAYEALKETYQLPAQDSKLICVFGSAGGGRDKWKRPELGKIAAQYCQQIILTNDDPYDEDPLEIINEIERGTAQLADGKFKVWKIVDRREAIRKALQLAKPGDVVAITGKGGDRWLHLAGGVTVPWSDREAVKMVK